MMTTDDLIANTTCIETREGHMLHRYDGMWFAYPHMDGELLTSGWVLMRAPDKPCPFATAVDAYQACVLAAQSPVEVPF